MATWHAQSLQDKDLTGCWFVTIRTTFQACSSNSNQLQLGPVTVLVHHTTQTCYKYSMQKNTAAFLRAMMVLVHHGTHTVLQMLHAKKQHTKRSWFEGLWWRWCTILPRLSCKYSMLKIMQLVWGLMTVSVHHTTQTVPQTLNAKKLTMNTSDTL